MFKNVLVYRIGPDWSATPEQLEAALDSQRFVPCGAHQEKSVGWVEPRGDKHGPLVETVAGQWMLRFMIESKSVPGPVVRRKAEETMAQIEATTGRKPGKKEARAIRDDTLQALLPMAFSNYASLWVWIDPQARLLVLDASSPAKADEAITALVKELPGLAVALVQTQITPQSAMAGWLTATSGDELPPTLAIERECELKSGDEEQSVVKFSRHNLDTDEVRQHVAEGKLPVKLALNWDGRVSFVLTEGMQLKKIKFLDGVFDGADQDDGFDTDVAISTAELSKLLTDLIDALGGEQAPGAPTPLPSPAVVAPASTSSAATAAPSSAPVRSAGGRITGNATAAPEITPTDADDPPF